MTIKSESAASATSYFSNGLVVTWGAFTFNEFMILIGTILTLATFAVNFYFQKRRDRREQEFHDRRMEQQVSRHEQDKDVEHGGQN